MRARSSRPSGARVPALEAFGVGGDGCQLAGMRLLAHQKDLAVVGLVEALAKLRFARRLIGSLAAEAVRQKADGAVLIDSPDFNLRLAKRLFRAGIPVVFYVSPQVWAWRSSRAETIAALGRAVLVLFRFEKRWWDARGLGAKVTWVGHPLVDRAAEELATPAPPPPAGARRVVLMPGSRAGEIRRNLPVLRDAVRLLRKRHPDLEIVLVRADSIPADLPRDVAGPGRRFVARGHGPAPRAPRRVGRRPRRVRNRDRGGASRERPDGRRLPRPSADVLARAPPREGAFRRDGESRERRRLRKGTVPELVQGDATPERVAAEAAAYLDDPARSAATRARLARGLEELGPPGAPGRTADALVAALAAAAPEGPA